ncbi:hypothetical protein MKW94_020457 [Papaver nudicaule]|uniref:RING-type E3 ubiquitin transferase n=1 Tax=Papaver nudicaule TaxID=74823 RepID=A0AA41VR35_PAPNU|nr:hypothetical protein [Papaver nudicaule]
MKFCKRYQEYMKELEKDLPGVQFKKHKKIFKKCRRTQFPSQNDDGVDKQTIAHCPNQCSVCDGTFFPSLHNEMSAIVGCFNRRAQKLLQVHLSSGFKKYFTWIKRKLVKGNHVAMIEEGKELVTYAMINAIAIRKILKKYDKIHYSKQGQAFKSQAQSMHTEILQSPWLHIFCHMCACSASSVTIVDGLKAADSKAKCPLCREEGVFEGAVHLEELNILLSRSCPDYWTERLQTERKERVRQAKEHWESHCRALMGV